MQLKQQINKTRVYTPAAQQALAQMREKIEAAKKLPHNGLFLEEPKKAPMTWGQAKEQLLDKSQAEAMGNCYELLLKMKELARQVNTMNMAFGLNMPPVMLPEVTSFFDAAIERCFISDRVARRMGVPPEQPKRQVSKPLNISNRVGTANPPAARHAA